MMRHLSRWTTQIVRLGIVLAVAGASLPARGQLATPPQRQPVAWAGRGPLFFSITKPGAAPRDAHDAAVLQRVIALDLAGATIDQALTAIQQVAGVDIVYTTSLFSRASRITLQATKITLAAALTAVLLDAGVDVQLSPSGTLGVVKRGTTALAPVGQPRLAGAVTGRVIDAKTRLPLGNATVRASPGGSTAVTTVDGRYTLRVLPVGSYRLTARLLGYTPTTVTVTVVTDSTVVMDVAMPVAVTQLDQVVTTATGRERRVEVGNAVATIQADSVALEAPVTSLTDLISGRADGVQVLAAGGLIGSGSRIRIRGISSASLDNSPLVLIDGVRVDNDPHSISNFISDRQYDQGPSRLDDLSPDDIESIDIVKGPSAATLYGTAAANGVISVVTKHGRAGAPRWTVAGEEGISTQPETFPHNYYNWGHSPSGAPEQCFLLSIAAGTCVSDSLTTYSPLRDPSASIFGTGFRQAYDASVSGGSAQTRYYLSGAYASEDGPMRMPAYEQGRLEQARAVSSLPNWQVHPSALNRVTLHSTVNAALGADADAAVSAGYVSSSLRLPYEFGFGGGVTGFTGGGAYAAGLNGPGIRDANHGYAVGGILSTAAPGDAFSVGNEQGLRRLTGSATASWRPAGIFAVRATIGLDRSNRTDDLLIRPGEGPNFGDLRLGLRDLDNTAIDRYTGDVAATLTLPVSPRLSSKTVVGVQYLRDQTMDTFAGAYHLAPGSITLSGGAIQADSQLNRGAATVGSYVEETVALNERLYLVGAIRGDANSAFGSAYRVAIYPKASASWLLSSEPFFPRVPALTSLRLRAAYGASGVQPGSTDALFNYAAIRVATDSGIVNGVRIASLGNAHLKPERSAELETGLDLSLWRDRMTIEFTYYHKQSSDALIARALDPELGAGSTAFANIGAVRNSGVELSVTTAVLDARAAHWDVTLSGSANKNRLLTLGPGVQPYFAVFGRQAPGYSLFGAWDVPILRYSDPNHTGIIEPSAVVLGDTAVFLGSAVPTREAALNTSLTLLRRIRLGAQLDYRGGQTLLNNTELVRCLVNCQAIADPRAPLRDQAAAIAATMGGANGNFSAAGYYQPADFMRVREVSVSYSAPDGLVRALRARSATLAVMARNLAVWTRYRGIDPEASFTSNSEIPLDQSTTPPVRYWILRMTLGL